MVWKKQYVFVINVSMCCQHKIYVDKLEEAIRYYGCPLNHKNASPTS